MASINFRSAQKILVGGVNSPVRAFKAVGGNPLIMAQGHGNKLFDTKGKTYTGLLPILGRIDLRPCPQGCGQGCRKCR